MAIPFPTSPYVGELFTYDGVTYVWNGADWMPYPPIPRKIPENKNYSFNEILIDNSKQFNSFRTRTINFEGINLNIYSLTSNTLVFSAQSVNSSVISVNSITSVTESNNTITVNNSNNTSSSFTIDAVTNGSYLNGVLTLSGTGNVNGIQITGFTTSSSTFTGGTVTGPTNFTNGLSANTFFATTYQNLPVSSLTAGQNINISGTSGNFTVSFTGTTGSSFTGGTVSGSTRFISGLTANTISATTYQNLPATPFLPLTGGTVNGQLSVNSTFGSTLIVTTSNGGSGAIYSLASNGVNAYGVYGVSSPGEFESITNGIGGYFAADASQGYANPTNRYSVQLVDGTEGLNKVLTSVTSDGKANWVTPKTNGSDLYLFYNY